MAQQPPHWVCRGRTQLRSKQLDETIEVLGAYHTGGDYIWCHESREIVLRLVTDLSPAVVLSAHSSDIQRRVTLNERRSSRGGREEIDRDECSGPHDDVTKRDDAQPTAMGPLYFGCVWVAWANGQLDLFQVEDFEKATDCSLRGMVDVRSIYPRHQGIVTVIETSSAGTPVVDNRAAAPHSTGGYDMRHAAQSGLESHVTIFTASFDTILQWSSSGQVMKEYIPAVPRMCAVSDATSPQPEVQLPSACNEGLPLLCLCIHGCYMVAVSAGGSATVFSTTTARQAATMRQLPVSSKMGATEVENVALRALLDVAAMHTKQLKHGTRRKAPLKEPTPIKNNREGAASPTSDCFTQLVSGKELVVTADGRQGAMTPHRVLENSGGKSDTGSSRNRISRVEYPSRVILLQRYFGKWKQYPAIRCPLGIIAPVGHKQNIRATVLVDATLFLAPKTLHPMQSDAAEFFAQCADAGIQVWLWVDPAVFFTQPDKLHALRIADSQRAITHCLPRTAAVLPVFIPAGPRLVRIAATPPPASTRDGSNRLAIDIVRRGASHSSAGDALCAGKLLCVEHDPNYYHGLAYEVVGKSEIGTSVKGGRRSSSLLHDGSRDRHHPKSSAAVELLSSRSPASLQALGVFIRAATVKNKALGMRAATDIDFSAAAGNDELAVTTVELVHGAYLSTTTLRSS